MKKIIQYCCFVLLLLISMNTNAQSSNNGLLSIATNTQWAVTGDYNNNNQELAIEIGSASENNLLVASGNIALSGKLIINFANSFTPIPAQSYIIISAANISGTFNSVVFPNGYIADINYNTTNIVLSNFRSSAIPITGSLVACNLSTTNRLSIAASGGVWSSSNTNIASINQAGIVTSLSNGVTNIRYSYSVNGIVKVSVANFTVAVAAAPNPITGNNSICVGSTTALNSTTPGGVWSSLSDRGIINANGAYTGTNAGLGQARYTVTNASGCTANTNYSITVNAIPTAPGVGFAPGTINPQAGAPTGGFCVGRVFNVVGAPVGGSWSATGIASITSGGQVTITSVGAGTIKYTYTSAAGCSSSKTLSGNGYACAARGLVINEKPEISNKFSIYPNPVHSSLKIQIDELIGAGKLQIIDCLGKIAKEQTLSVGINLVDVSKLSKGIYFVSLITNGEKITKKIVVE